MSLRSYPTYKESGDEWLRDVPTGWEVVPNRAALTRVQVVVGEEWRNTQLLSLTLQGVIDRDIDSGHGKYPADFGTYQKVSPGDLVFCLFDMDETPRTVGLAHSAGMITSAYDVYRCGPTAVPAFVAYFYLHVDSFKGLRPFYTGLRKVVRPSTFLSIKIPLPPVSDQKAIAAFLDRETAKIDALVAEQERLIELLKEKRQAVISHAATKGLNPDVPMKDSGIEWLGQVPAHWGVARCGRHLAVLSGFAFPSTGFSSDPSLPKLLRGVNVGVGSLRWDDVVHWPRAVGDELDAYALTVGDLVIGMDRPLIAEGMRVAEVQPDDLPCLLLQRVACLRSRGQLRLRYLKLLLASPMFVAHFSPETTGVSVPHISPEQITNFVIPMPPIAEQDEVVDHVEALVAKSTALIAEARRGIDLLLERRTALISAAVTGQIDVRPESMRTAA
jgi:type I restriction enzyme, S subunit